MNCVEYFTGGDEPKICDSDDFSAKVCNLLLFILSYAESLISYACVSVGKDLNLFIEKFSMNRCGTLKAKVVCKH